MGKDFFILANWKMNKSPKETKDFLSVFESLLTTKGDFKKFIFFPPALSAYVFSKKWLWGGQNCYYALKGAFTGENSPLTLKQMGAKFCLVGHTERRTYFKENEALLAKKINALLECGISPIFCTQEETENSLSKKFFPLNAFTQNKQKKSLFFVAYEPSKAIGSGKTASFSNINRFQEKIRKYFLKQGIQNFKFLYGGSVHPKNAKLLLKNCPLLDGFLVGGASLKPHSLYNIYQSIRDLLYQN